MEFLNGLPLHRDPELMNRENRRGEERNQPAGIKEFNNAHKAFHDQVEVWKKISHQTPMKEFVVERGFFGFIDRMRSSMGFARKFQVFSPVIYRENPVLPKIAYALKNFSNAINQARRIDPKIEGFAEEDIWKTQIGGISLADIENMNLPLAPEDMRGISRFFRYTRFSPRLTFNQMFAQEVGMYLPAQVAGRGLENSLSKTLRPLNDRLFAYLDYYLPFITSSNLDEDDEYRFIMHHIWIGFNLSKSLALYMPARLGLTPSSALKLIYEKNASTSSYQPSWWGITPMMVSEASEAYTQTSVPQSLKKYQHYDAKTELKASQILIESYTSKADILLSTPQQQHSLFERVRVLKKTIGIEALKSKDKVLILEVKNNPLIKEVRIASGIKQNLLIVILFADDQTHLTLELNGENRLFGIPVGLRRLHPNIEELLAQDILGVIVDRFSPTQSIAETPLPIIKNIISPIRQIEPRIITSEEEEEEELPKPPKRRNLPSKLSDEPELPKAIPLQVRKTYQVRYSESIIKEFLGRKSGSEEVEIIMNYVRKFELGEKGVKPLRKIPGCYILRVGDRRIILQLNESNIFDIHAIGPRGEVYDNL